MKRSIPLWFLLLTFLLWAILVVTFGWSVKATLEGSVKSKRLNDMVVEIASFPTTARTVLLEITSYLSNSYRDEFIRVEREANADYSSFEPVPTVPSIDVQGLLLRVDPAGVAHGWRLIAGAFTIDEEIENAALLMSPELEVVKLWVLDEEKVDGIDPQPSYRKLVHGLEILDDASLIFTFGGGVSLQRVDRCGRRLWSISGDFHHAVTLDNTGESVWTLSSYDMISQVSVESGEILRQISMNDIISKNPMIDILGLRRFHPNDLSTNSRNTKGRWLDDWFHLNDVDPLPAAFADRFEGFDAGDLLVSARALNLVFIIDPDTLEVKWWRVGAAQRQHDPDWLPNGEVMIFNNRMSRDFSEIVSIDPDTFQRTTLFDGRQNDFYTRIRGKHQMLDTGAL